MLKRAETPLDAAMIALDRLQGHTMDDDERRSRAIAAVVETGVAEPDAADAVTRMLAQRERSWAGYDS